MEFTCRRLRWSSVSEEMTPSCGSTQYKVRRGPSRRRLDGQSTASVTRATTSLPSSDMDMTPGRRSHSVQYSFLSTWMHSRHTFYRLHSISALSSLNYTKAVFLVASLWHPRARMSATSRACHARGLWRMTPTHGQTASTTPQQTAGRPIR